MTDALLVLEDGTAFRGRSLGATGETFGEAVFNTAMSGYQEVLTDPSYAGQIVTMTYPLQGNYGVNDEDPESGRVQVAGFAVREAARRASNWRSRRSLQDELEATGTVGIEGIDTRRLVLRIRDEGAMRAAVSTEDLDPKSLTERVRAQPGMEGADLARRVSTTDPYDAERLVGAVTPADGRVYRVAAYDFGIKRNILRILAAEGCETTVYPAQTPAEDVLSRNYDGVFCSNGPGDPAATKYGITAIDELLGKVPLFGICLGHQLLGLALGAKSYKLKFGHRGANQPVLNTDTGIVEITSHNHGFAIDPSPWLDPDHRGGGGIAEPGVGWGLAGRSDAPAVPGDRTPTDALDLFAEGTTRRGRVALTHWNLNDDTLEGLRCLDVPAFGVQYHPEAAPGPHDSRYLFDRFRDLMRGAA